MDGITLDALAREMRVPDSYILPLIDELIETDGHDAVIGPEDGGVSPLTPAAAAAIRFRIAMTR